MDCFDVLTILSERDKEIIKEDLDDPVAQMLADMEGKIPKEIGERIVREFEDKNQAYQIGIARTKGDMAEDNFKNGYKIFGDEDSSFGISYYDNSYNEILYILHQCVAAPYYKSSDKVYIFKIPKESINYYEEGKSKPILIQDTESNELGNDCARVLPEYILGYITVDKEGIKNLIENPNYKDEHDYLHDGLIYDGRVQYDKNNNSKNKAVTTRQIANEKKENLFKKFWNKIKERILQINKKSLPPGKDNEYLYTDSKKQEPMDKYYVGEVKPRQEFFEKKPKRVISKDGFTK